MKRDCLGLVPASAYHDPFIERNVWPLRLFMPLTADGNRRVLLTNVQNYPKSSAYRRSIRGIVGNGLLLSEGPLWRGQRKSSAPGFTPKAAARVAETSAGVVERFIHDGDIPVGRPFDLQKLAERLALEIATLVLLSMQSRDRREPLRAILSNWSRKSPIDVWDTVCPEWMPVPKGLRRHRMTRVFRGLVDCLLAERSTLSSSAAPCDVYALLGDAFDGDDDRPLSGGLSDQFMTLLAAGTLTTSDTIFWSLASMAVNETMQDWLAGSSKEFDLGADAVGHALPAMAEAEAVVREIMRLYPGVPIMVRRAIEDDVIDGREIKAGTLVYVSPWVMHRHRGYWQDPDALDVSRFMPGTPKPDRFVYMPFGDGPHICIGQHFALAEVMVVLSKLVSTFRIRPLDDRPIRPSGSLTIPPVDPPKFLFELR